MPTRAKDGREVGGAEKERRKKARIEADRQRGSVSSALQVEPPPQNTAGHVRWGSKLLAAVAYRAAQDRSIFETERDQLRFVADCCAKLGVIRDKAAEQELIDQRLAELDGEKSKSSGLETVSGLPAPKISRPAGRAGSRRTEAVP